MSFIYANKAQCNNVKYSGLVVSWCLCIGAGMMTVVTLHTFNFRGSGEGLGKGEGVCSIYNLQERETKVYLRSAHAINKLEIKTMLMASFAFTHLQNYKYQAAEEDGEYREE